MGYPNKIICLTEESVETLFCLGKENLIAGVSQYVKRPAKAQELPVVSAFTKSNIKKIVALKPDLILGYSDIQQDIAKELIARGQNVWISNHQSLVGILDYISLLGRVVDANNEAVELIKFCQKKMSQAQDYATSLKRKPKVYFEEWDEPMISSIRWVTELLELCGGEVIFPNDHTKHLAKDRFVTHQEVIKKNPDIILACHCGKKVKLDKIYKREGYQKIKAIQTNQLFELDPAVYLQPGPAPFLAGIDEILGIYNAWTNLDT